ncbi:lebercilin-like protein isoform X1 [Ranitomeya variabilis]|uniref:lebercilin-like protein isoform X1 n=1 Tax=Ranitomeya variabilis TaxID=490064 RepID=UPI00405620F2
MSFKVPGEDREWRQEPLTDPEQRSFCKSNDPNHNPSSDGSSTSPSDRSLRSKTSSSGRSPRSKTSSSDRSPRSKTSSSDRSPRSKMNSSDRSPRSKTSSSNRSPRNKMSSSDQSPRGKMSSSNQSPRSKMSSSDQSPRSKMSSSDRSPRSKTNRNDRSPSKNSKNSESVNEAHKAQIKTSAITNNKTCQTFSKVDKVFSWRKPPPRKRSSMKPQHPPLLTHKNEGDVARRVLSAKVRKIKELNDQLCDVQRTLEEVSRENKLLTSLQYRHMKALDKYESSEGGIHHLIFQLGNEVRMLRQSLRSTQQSERGLSVKLRMAESELLKVKDNLLRLQRLSEDKNLAEREELNQKLSSLLIKKEIDSTKVKVLEKQLHLTTRLYDRQMVLESKKGSEAQDMARNLQEQILLLQQKMKEKEREIHIKNIYAHRMPRNIWKYGGLGGHGGFTFTRSTQTESEAFTPKQPDTHENDEYADLQDKSSESGNESAREEDSNSQMGGEEAPTLDVLQDEKSNALVDIDGHKSKVQDREHSTEWLNQLLMEEDLAQGDARTYEKNHPENLRNKDKVGSVMSVETSHTKPLLPRISRRYIFTAATENLHQGLPAIGPIPSLYKAQNCKSLKLQCDSALSQVEFSLPEIEIGNENEKIAKCPQVSLSNRKKNLMEELFGPGYDMQNCFSNVLVNFEK